jgi:predicted flap endonuclease-1-like 5' DNA nuclease
MFSCCFWWFLLGLLVGWLLNWLLCKLFNCRCREKVSHHAVHSPRPQPAVAAPSVAPTVAATPVAKAEPVTPVAKAFVLDATAAKAAGYKLKGPDDLTVIEGIGPKINELFKQAGFHTFAQVSKMSEAQMQKILNDAGPRYRLAKPGTWAKQAALCNENKWAELKKLQDELKGGV